MFAFNPETATLEDVEKQWAESRRLAIAAFSVEDVEQSAAYIFYRPHLFSFLSEVLYPK